MGERLLLAKVMRFFLVAAKLKRSGRVGRKRAAENRSQNRMISGYSNKTGEQVRDIARTQRFLFGQAN